MKLTNKTTHEIKFSVEQFVGQEGGMDHNVFGEPLDTLPEAIHVLEVANIKEKQSASKYGWTPWVIVCHVTTKNEAT